MALTDNILAYYKLDESSGNAADATGNGYTLSNVNTVGYAPALINNGADFGTANTDKRLSRTGLIGTDGSTSVSLWVKLRTEIGSGVYTFFNNITETTAVALKYEYNGGTRRLNWFREKNNVGNEDLYETIALGTSNWVHIVCTYDGANKKIYVNGVEEATMAASGNGSGNWSPGGGATLIGAQADSNNPPSSIFNFASTYVDEVGIWSRALTSGEITQLYNGGAGIQYPFASLATGNFFLATL